MQMDFKISKINILLTEYIAVITFTVGYKEVSVDILIQKSEKNVRLHFII